MKKNVKNIKAVVFDVDGVIFTNEVWEGIVFPDNVTVKPRLRSYYDGQGISLLRAIGIRVACVTNENGLNAQAIERFIDKLNSLPSAKKPVEEGGWHPIKLYTGCGGVKKTEVVEEWLDEIGISWRECAVMGDDLVDIPMLKKAALVAAPAQAEEVVKNTAHFIARREGGKGAVRDFVNFILESRGIDPTKLPFQ